MKKIVTLFTAIAFSTTALLSCQSNEAKTKEDSTPQNLTSQSTESSTIVGKWEFLDIKGDIKMPMSPNVDGIAEAKKHMIGSTLEFKSDGTTQSLDKMTNELYDGTYKVDNGKLMIDNKGVSGTLTYKVEGDILTMIWHPEDYYNHLLKFMNQGGNKMTIDDVKKMVTVSDLTYTAKRVK